MASKRRSIRFNAAPKTYYIATTGDNGNDGLTTSTPWATLTYAVGATSPVIAGDTVFVKSGNYGAENVVFAKSGIVGNPISVIGYKTTPGDAPPLLINNADPYAAYVTTDMPTLNGGNRTSGGYGIDINTQTNIVLKNIQIEQYQRGVVMGRARLSTYVLDSARANNILYNVNVKTMGSISASYDGYGIYLGVLSTASSNGNNIHSCLVVNCAAEAIGINGNYNRQSFNKVFCNENTTNAATDYYNRVAGSYNVIENCYIERTALLTHTGHGFTCKGNAEHVVDGAGAYPTINAAYNQFYNCTAKNMHSGSFVVRHRGSDNNYFYKCSAVGTYDGGGSGKEGVAILIRDGASNNTFEACSALNCNSAIKFQDTTEDGGATGHPGNGNKIINFVANNCYFGFYFDSYSIASDAGANTVANSTFYKCVWLYECARGCTDMTYVNNIYRGTTSGVFREGAFNAEVTSDQFTYCCFYSINGGMPGGFVAGVTGGITTDPLFISTSAADSAATSCLSATTQAAIEGYVAASAAALMLQSGSGSKDAGTVLAYVTSDFNEVARPTSNCSIGAFEK